MKHILLSKYAEKDLENIFDYTEKEFGKPQAVAYVSSFDESFSLIAKNPEVGRHRNDVRKDLRSLIKDKHIIFYRLQNNGIRIVRILHTSQDIKNFL